MKLKSLLKRTWYNTKDSFRRDGSLTSPVSSISSKFKTGESTMKATKQCTKCKTINNISEFTKDKTRKDGLYPWCRSCRKIYKKKTIRKYTTRVCTNCGHSWQARSDHKHKTTLCRQCINESQKGRHEYHGTRLYFCFNNMRQRCVNPKASSYEMYGGSGISVCSEWATFKPFAKWAIENGYTDELTIDRIDPNGNYEPSNCRWATYTQQSQSTKLIHKTNTSGYRGVSKHGNKWASYITVRKKRVHIGLYLTPKEAAKERDSYIVRNKLIEFELNF